MDYTPAPQTSLNRDVTIEVSSAPPSTSTLSCGSVIVCFQDVRKYFVNYLLNDTLGVIANAHTVFADREPKMAMSPRCRELAKLFSIAVDFPKTGVPAVIPPQLSVYEYPDFMEKHERMSYKSSGVIGKLFRAVKDRSLSFTALEFSHQDAVRCYDPKMEVNGFKDHIKEALSAKGMYDSKLRSLMNYYGIKTEAEILLGGSTKLPKGFNRHRDADAVRQAVRALRNEARSWFSGRSTKDADLDDRLLAKASAWYHVTYHPEYWGYSNGEVNESHFLSFPWCIHEKLIILKTRS